MRLKIQSMLLEDGRSVLTCQTQTDYTDTATR